MGILGDIADPNVEKMVQKHWPLFLTGGLIVLYLLYVYFSKSSSSGSDTQTGTYTTGTTASGGTVDDTALNDQTSLAIAQIQAQNQTNVAAITTQGTVDVQSILSNESVTNTNTVTAGTNYQTLVNASAVQTDTLAATAAQQNIDMSNALTGAFSNYALSTAQIATAESSAAASTATSNNSANGADIIGSTLAGAGAIAAKVYGIGGIPSLGISSGIGGLSVGLRTPQVSFV